MKRAIFIDRDGVINKLPPKYPNDGIGDIRNYITKWEDFEFLDGVIEAFDLIAKDARYTPIIISNQGGAIGRKLVNYNTIDAIFAQMDIEITRAIGGFYKHAYYFCPHLISDNCACIKPNPGMLYKAAIEHDIVLADSWMIGDSWSDIIAGSGAFTKTIYISDKLVSHSIVKPSLLEAVKFILKA